ncbi:MAG TPA: tetratricopeptide repeat protein [Blastocatellia bacterium]
MSVRGELHLLSGNGGGVFILEEPRFTIGRGPQNSLCLPDAAVSRYHAQIVRLGRDFLLQDLGSTNGSYVNGVRVSEQLLNNDDTIQFGKAGPKLQFKQFTETGSQPSIERHPTGTSSLIRSLSNKLDGIETDSHEEVNMRCVLAEAHINMGDYQKALSQFSKYSDPARLQALPPQFRANVLYWMGRIQAETKEYASAIDSLQQSLALYEETGDDTGIAQTRATLGRALIGINDLISARENLHRALLMARRAGNTRLTADIHLMVGKVDWKEGDLEGARYNWSRAARLAEDTDDAILQARVQLQLALILYSEGNLKEAVPAYQAAIDKLEKSDNVRFLLKAYSQLSRLLTRMGSWVAAERLLEDRLRLARENRLTKAEAIALTDLAEIRLLQGNVSAAGSVIETALQRHGATVYPRTQRILARVLSMRRQHAEAIAALTQGLEAARRKDALEEQVLTLLELALAYIEVGNTEQARKQIEAAESISSLDPALTLMGRTLYTRGCLLAALNQPSDANLCFTQSLSIFKTIDDPYRMGQCHLAMGALRTKLGRLESARAHLEEAQRIFNKLGAVAELNKVELQLGSGTYDQVQASMTLTMSSNLYKTAPLMLSLTQTLFPESITEHNLPRRVLLAEANDELASLLMNGFEVENYIVDSVQDGRAALEKALDRDARYDILVLDALLEHSSGFDICRELRKRKIEKPVILLGGRRGVEDKIEALQSGADDLISKDSLIFEELLAKMEALLR